jgi:hypothetical protein
MNGETFSDPVAQQYYQQGETELATAQSAESVLRMADTLARQDGRADLMQSACYFLAAAHFLEIRDPAKSAHAYHQAGHQLQRLTQWTHAARAFSNAGRFAEQAARVETTLPAQHHLQHFAVRSYSRANHCYAETGELDGSEQEYLKEQEARVVWAKMQGKHPLARLAWKATSNYGTSFARWGVWVAGMTGAFGVLYELFFRLHWLEPMETANTASWIPLWSGLYYAVNVTAALGLVDYQPSHFISQGVVIVNVLLGYLLLGIGIGIIGRMIKTRS